MENLTKCSCRSGELPIHTYQLGWYHIECCFCRKKTKGMYSEESAIEAWNEMMREEYSKVETNDKETQCATCAHWESLEDDWYRCNYHKTTQKDKIYKCVDYEKKAQIKQVGGDHYKKMDLQPWDAMPYWMTKDQYNGYLLGSAIAYLGRFNATREGKGGRQDIEKAKHYLEKLLEVMK